MTIRNLLAATFAVAVPGFAHASVAQVPEPETIALLGIGALALVIARWRRKK